MMPKNGVGTSTLSRAPTAGGVGKNLSGHTGGTGVQDPLVECGREASGTTSGEC